MTKYPRKLPPAIDLLQSIRFGAKLDASEIVYVMTCLRQSLEATGTRTRFPTLKTYCDWALHPKLDRKDHFHMLKQASIKISAAKLTPVVGRPFVTSTLGDVIGAFALINEMNAFCIEFGDMIIPLRTEEAECGFFPALAAHLCSAKIAIMPNKRLMTNHEALCKTLGVDVDILAYMISSTHDTKDDPYEINPFFEIQCVSKTVPGLIAVRLPSNRIFALSKPATFGPPPSLKPSRRRPKKMNKAPRIH